MYKNNNIAIIFDDLTEFFVMQPAVDAIKKEKINLDIIVPYDSGYNGLAEHTFKKIKELGYSPLTDAPKNKTYQILLTPYPKLSILDRIKYIYHIRYPYGAATTKPNPVFQLDWKIQYDALFSFNTNETKFLPAYGVKCYTVPHWSFYNFKKDNKTGAKPVLLVLPTFGEDTSCASHFTEKSIKNLKDHYRIIVKAHHATHFQPNEQESIKKLKHLADEFYDSDIAVIELLKKADVVLSDNSGAIFEAICAGVPVALFAKDFNSRQFHGVNTLQQDLINQNLLPHTNTANEILTMLQNIDKYIPKQKKLKKELFLSIDKDPFSSFINIIKEYLGKNPEEDYNKILHDLMIKEWQSDKKTIDNLKSEQVVFQNKIDDLNKKIQAIHQSTSWKITSPLRKLKSNLKGEKNE